MFPVIYILPILTFPIIILLRRFAAENTMRRPGPLQDLPLEFFLPPNPNVPNSPFKLGKGGKRPISPGAPSTFSPAKRRILNAEGIFSPETLKSPVSVRARSPAHFGDLVRGPDSPARKLDFGLPKNYSQSTAGSSTVVNSAASSQFDTVLMTPTRPSSASTNILAPSPELLPKSTSTPISSSSSFLMLNDTPEMDDYFSPRPCHPATRLSSTPTMSRRELPPPPDRQSVHYPGFDVLLDTHIASLCARSSSLDSADSVGADLKQEKEGCKENLPPKRKAKKVTTAPTSSESFRAGPPSPCGKVEKMGKSRSTPVTTRS